jgi:peptidoglycan/xylan/chitin deacetylase (PgdA/CDA1 family)
MHYLVIYIYLALILFCFIGLKTMILMPTPKGIRVLMYHKISTDNTDFLTVSTTQFEIHLKYLQSLGYQFITTQDLLNFYLKKLVLPSKPLLLSFDDGYLNNLELAYPILKTHKAKATIFIPSSFVGTTNKWDNGNDLIMTVEQLKNLDPSVFELGLHSHTHINFGNISIDTLENEIRENIAFFSDNNIPYTPVLAYPYGGRPRGDAFLKMIYIFKKFDIQAAFRIGNKVNAFNTNDLYELKRIDIRGTDGLDDFKKKVEKGRVKLF